MKKNRRSIAIEGGAACPKCGNPMHRFQHGAEWRPKHDQPYYYLFWDKCYPCRHTQHYERAKVYAGADELQRVKESMMSFL